MPEVKPMADTIVKLCHALHVQHRVGEKMQKLTEVYDQLIELAKEKNRILAELLNEQKALLDELQQPINDDGSPAT